MSNIASKITGSSKVNQYNHERTELNVGGDICNAH